jgi:hypothetical protein
MLLCVNAMHKLVANELGSDKHWRTSVAAWTLANISFTWKSHVVKRLANVTRLNGKAGRIRTDR